MRAWLAGLAALAVLGACGEEKPGAEVIAAVELCGLAYGTPLYPERWASCDCLADALMELPAGAERLAGANWVVAELGYPILAAAEGTLSGGGVEAFVEKAGVAGAAELGGWYHGYAAQVQPSAEVTLKLIQDSGATLAGKCVM